MGKLEDLILEYNKTKALLITRGFNLNLKPDVLATDNIMRDAEEILQKCESYIPTTTAKKLIRALFVTGDTVKYERYLREFEEEIEKLTACSLCRCIDCLDLTETCICTNCRNNPRDSYVKECNMKEASICSESTGYTRGNYKKVRVKED